eukprot:9751-Chlamydomonas_euryale.AAC.1
MVYPVANSPKDTRTDARTFCLVSTVGQSAGRSSGCRAPALQRCCAMLLYRTFVWDLPACRGHTKSAKTDAPRNAAVFNNGTSNADLL